MTVRILAAAVLAAFFGVRAEAAPLDVYGHLPTLEDVAISPDGNVLAYALTTNAKRLVVIQSLQTHEALGAINIEDAKLRDLSWADSKHLIITTSTTATGIGLIGPRQEWSMAQVFNVDTHRSIALMERNDSDTQTMNVITGTPRVRTVDGHVVAFVEGIYFRRMREDAACSKSIWIRGARGSSRAVRRTRTGSSMRRARSSPSRTTTNARNIGPCR